MIYGYKCMKCELIFEVDKRMTAPDPKGCPECKGKIERYFSSDSSPAVTYANRPPWTYKGCLKYKECSHNGGPRFKVDPKKHGDLGAWHCSNEIAKKKGDK